MWIVWKTVHSTIENIVCMQLTRRTCPLFYNH
jgi:hypothetical protein